MIHTEKTHFLFRVWGWFLFLVGIVLILIGLIGLFLPLLPGTLFIFAGLALMGEKRLHHWWLSHKR